MSDDVPSDSKPTAADSPRASGRRDEPATSDDAPSDSKPTATDSPLASARRLVQVREAPATGRYMAGDEIGRGGMGRVVEATDQQLGRVVALKQALTTDPEMLRRFARETRITARLEHPSIVPVYDAGTADGSPYYVMRKVSGQPLEGLVEAASSLDRRLALVPNVLAAAQAIGHAHGRGIIHRDLKPSNILVGDLGETVVIDWGLAKVVDELDDDASVIESPPDSVHTKFGAVVGTPGFMAPEQLRGEPADRRCDVYALGATLYYVLARRSPHHAASGDEMMAAAAKGPPIAISDLAAGLPPELGTIVDKALSFEATERYADAGGFAADLQQFLTGQLVASHRYSTRERLVRFVRRYRVAVATVAIAVLALAIGGGFAVRRVLAERDRADDEAQRAMQRQRESEVAEARVRDRNDHLLLSQARTLLSTNPTAAVATLKQLAADPARWTTTWRHARAIAAEARRAGVAREMPGPVTPASIAMSSSGTRVALAGDRIVRGYDLAARTTHTITTYDKPPALGFASEDRLVVGTLTAIEIFDWKTGARRQIPLPTELQYLEVTAKYAAWLDYGGALWWMPLDDGTPAKLAEGERVRYFAASTDGKLAFSSNKRLAVVEIVDRPVIRDVGSPDAISLAWSTDSSVLAAGFHTRIERVAFPSGTRTKIATAGMVVALYPGPADVTYLNAGIVFVARGATSPAPYYARAVDSARGLHPLSHDRLITGNDNRLLVFRGSDTMEIHVPTESMQRIATRASSPYVVSPIRGHLLYWNVDDLVPPPTTIVRDVGAYARVGRSDYLVWSTDGVWRWIDQAAGISRPLFEQMMPLEMHASAVGQRAAFVDQERKGFVVEKSGHWIQLDGTIDRMLFLHDGKLLFGDSTGRVISLDSGKGAAVVLHARAHRIHSFGSRGSWIVALYVDGHVWRRDLVSGKAQTTTIPPAPPLARLPMLDDGQVFLPVGDRLMRWLPDGTMIPHAKLPAAVTTLAPAGTRILAGTPDGAGYVIDPEKPDQASVGITGGHVARIQYGPSSFAMVETAMGSRIIDLDNAQSWPVFHRGYRRLLSHPTITDDGRSISALVSNVILEWPVDLPETADATRAWLDQLTNATAELGPTTMTWHHATKR